MQIPTSGNQLQNKFQPNVKISTTGNQLQNKLIVRQVNGILNIHKCSWCLKTFVKLQDLNLHLRTYRNGSCSPANGNVNANSTCRWCQKSFKSPSGLNYHLYRSSCRENEDLAKGTHRCKWCLAKAETFEGLNYHIKWCPEKKRIDKNYLKHINITTAKPPVHSELKYLKKKTIFRAKIHFLTD